MKRLKILTVVFDTEFQSWEIPALRGAIVDKVGRENILFHNHLNEGFLYKYPLIQYKTINKRPAILCLDQGVDEIHKYFEQKDWSVLIGDRQMEMKIYRLNLNQFTMQVWDKDYHYNIRNWIALNQENIHKYNGLENLSERVGFLEKTLTGNIISFAKGIDWDVDRQIKVHIKNMGLPRPVKLKGKTMLGFNLEFSSNVFLPNYIGLGKAVSTGFGVVKCLREKSDNL